MAQFNPSKKSPTDFNKGAKYKAGDGVQATTVNNLIESALWVQELAFDTLDYVVVENYDPVEESLTIGFKKNNT